MSKKSSYTSRVPSVGLTSFIRALTGGLDKAEPRLGTPPKALTAEDKTRASKPRKGSEKVVGQLAPIVQQYGLDSPALHSATMVARNKDAEALVPLQQRLQKISKRVDDELFSAQTETWGMALQFYALLQRRAQSDGELAASLDPIKKVFAYRHPKVKEGAPTKVQTRAKAKLKEAVALAARHNVQLDEAPKAPSPAASANGEANVVAANGHTRVTTLTSTTPTPTTTGAAAPAKQVAGPVVAAGAATGVVPAAPNGATNGVTNGAASNSPSQN